jgi:hypothetical protein
MASTIMTSIMVKPPLFRFGSFCNMQMPPLLTSILTAYA